MPIFSKVHAVVAGAKTPYFSEGHPSQVAGACRTVRKFFGESSRGGKRPAEIHCFIRAPSVAKCREIRILGIIPARFASTRFPSASPGGEVQPGVFRMCARLNQPLTELCFPLADSPMDGVAGNFRSNETHLPNRMEGSSTNS